MCGEAADHEGADSVFGGPVGGEVLVREHRRVVGRIELVPGGQEKPASMFLGFR
jgi:hypothetical protein